MIGTPLSNTLAPSPLGTFLHMLLIFNAKHTIGVRGESSSFMSSDHSVGLSLINRIGTWIGIGAMIR